MYYFSAIPGIIAYDKNGIKIDMSFEKENTAITVNMLVSNNSGGEVSDFLFQAAVPKVSWFLKIVSYYSVIHHFHEAPCSQYFRFVFVYMTKIIPKFSVLIVFNFFFQSLQLQMLTPSSTSMGAGASLTQVIKVNNPNKVR